MPSTRAQKLSSVRAGNTAADRRVVGSASATTSAPSLRTHGYAVQHRGQAVLTVQVSGTDAEFGVVLWAYSAVSESWGVLYEAGYAVGVFHVPVDLAGLDRVYAQVSSVSGTSAALSVWVAEVVPA